MASDLVQRLAMEEEEKNLIGIPECLLNLARAVVPHGGGRVDDPEAISEALALDVREKGRCLVVHFKQKGGVLRRRCYGQIGFIRREKIQTHPSGTEDYAVAPVTTTHNLRRSDDGEWNAVQAEALINKRHTAEFEFDRLNWKYSPVDDPVTLHSSGRKKESDRSTIWKYGVDISYGDRVETPTEGITSEGCSFAPVRDTFRLEVGQKVGMSVIFSAEANPTSKTVARSGEKEVHISDDELETIYGKPERMNIYTGVITDVGDNHIEYDINTFTGCSGATVFLLDKGQPPSVQQCDYGKAVAVHAGAHPFLKINLGFKIQKGDLSDEVKD